MPKAQHRIQRHAESRQGRVRATAGANPQDAARKYHVRRAELYPERLFRGLPVLRPISLCLRAARLQALRWCLACGLAPPAFVKVVVPFDQRHDVVHGAAAEVGDVTGDEVSTFSDFVRLTVQRKCPLALVVAR